MNAAVPEYHRPLLPTNGQLQEWADRLHRQRRQGTPPGVVTAGDGRGVGRLWVENIDAEPLDLARLAEFDVGAGDLLVVIGSTGAEQLLSACQREDPQCPLHHALRREAHVLSIAPVLQGAVAEHSHDVMVVSSQDPVLLMALQLGITQSLAARMDRSTKRMLETPPGWP